MAEVGNIRAFVKKIVPRTFKAASWGFVMYLVVYYVPLLIYPSEALLFVYNLHFHMFGAVVVFFVVLCKLFSGTILEHAFGIARALVTIVYTIYVFNNGIISLTVSVSETTMDLVVDLRAFLEMLISVNLLALAKSVFQATNFLVEKAEAMDIEEMRRQLVW